MLGFARHSHVRLQVNLSRCLRKILIGLTAVLFLYSCIQDKGARDISKPQKESHYGNLSKDSVDHPGTYLKRKVGIPVQAYIVLDYIKKNNRPMSGYVGGRLFYNRENKLPNTLSKNIVYREWDIYPKIKGKSRGPERLITGSDGVAYFTHDHYRTFIKIFPLP